VSSRRPFRVVAAGVLAATVLSGSACAAPGPTPLPSLPSPIVSTLPSNSPTSSPPTGPPIPTLTQGTDAWAAYEAAWQHCPGTVIGPLILSGTVRAAFDIVPVNECAVLLPGSGDLWVASADSFSRFPSVALSIDSGFVPQIAPTSDGIWIADVGLAAFDTTPTLTFYQPDGAVHVTLPADTFDIAAVQPTGTSLLVATDTGDPGGMADSAALLSVTPDSTVTTVWRAPGSSILGLTTDGATTVMVVAPSTRVGFSVLADYGHGWKQTAVAPAGLWPLGLAVHGNDIVVVAQRTDASGGLDAMVTYRSRDGNATWTTQEMSIVAVGVSPTLLGFHGATAWAASPPQLAPQGVLQLTDTNGWVPADPIPVPSDSVNLAEGNLALTTCGLWILDTPIGADNILTHLPLPGPGC